MSSITLPTAEAKTHPCARPRRGLSLRLIAYIILFSSIVTFFATALQLYLDYAKDVRDIESRLEQVERSNLNSIRLSLWTMDNEQLRTQLEGILALPDIEFLEVYTLDGPVLSVGVKQGRNLIQETYLITYPYRGNDLTLGSLYVVASLDGVYRRLFDKAVVIFGTQAVKTLLVAGFIFCLFQWLITRHLEHISRFLRTRGFQNFSEIFTLNRRERDRLAPDELDDVVQALNTMHRNLQTSYHELHRSEERFHLAMQGANDGLWDWDIRKNRVYYSPRWRKMLGIRESELMDDPDAWLSKIHPEDVEDTKSALTRHLQGMTSQFKSVHRLLHRDGRYRWIMSRARALSTNDGAPYRMVGTNTDITRQKENESALKRTTRTLEAEQERRIKAERLACVGELSASIAHEIRSPLASIINCLTLIRLDSVGPQEREEVVEILSDETQRLQRILENFLEYARIKPAVREPNNVIRIVQETVEAVSLGIDREKNFEVVTNFDSLTCFALVDADQIRQVLWNLMLNSIQAMPNGGCLTVSSQADSGRFWLAVRDSGDGIPETLRERLMDPFVTGREGGTGLGLAIVQRILMQHDSELLVESIPSDGTTMKFSLRSM